MLTALAAILGFVLGAVSLYFMTLPARARLKHQCRDFEATSKRASEAEKRAAADRMRAEWLEQRHTSQESILATARSSLKAERAAFEEETRNAHAVLAVNKKDLVLEQERVSRQAAKIDEERAALDSRTLTVVTVKDLQAENTILKTDIRNLGIACRNRDLEHHAIRQLQKAQETRATALAAEYLEDVEKSVGATINANNYAACKQRLQKAVAWCREIGFSVPEADEARLLSELKADFEMEVRKQVEREEQARIKAKIREEQKREREIQREMEIVERERAVIEAALAKAMAKATSDQSEEIIRLRERLAEAEAKGERVKSQAQLTKAGHIYVISNIGSFGEGVYKIGMTRRLEPEERIDELGDASVPFGFDVHMMISCNDAPALEHALHQEFHKRRVNKVNPRKEYFRIDLDSIRKVVESRHGEVRYVADAEALEYRQSETMSDADQEAIEQAFEAAEKAVGVESTEE